MWRAAMVDQTLPEVRALQEMNRGRRHQELKGRHKKTITDYVSKCSIQNLERIIKFINKDLGGLL